MSNLTEFLLARIADDEDRARTALADNHEALARAGAPLPELALSLVTRVKAECETKRRIVELAGLLPATRQTATAEYLLRWLALPYADHRDYREEWRP